MMTRSRIYPSIISGIMLVLVTGANASSADDVIASTNFNLPNVGAVFVIEEEFGGVTSVSEVQVIATGEDFAIFYNGTLKKKKRKIKKDRLSVHFSGVHATSCVNKLPNLADRAKLASLWPLSTGKNAEVFSGTVKAKYRVGIRTVLTSNQKKIPVHWVESELDEDGFTASLEMAVSPHLAHAVEARWGHGPIERRYEANAAEEGAFEFEDNTLNLMPGLNPKKLGKCKALFK